MSEPQIAPSKFDRDFEDNNSKGDDSKLSPNRDAVRDSKRTGYDEKGDAGSDDTLSRGNLLAEFLRVQKINMRELTEEEFLARYQAYVREAESKKPEIVASVSPVPRSVASRPKQGADRRASFHGQEGSFKSIVLKFTTLSEGCVDAPSFTVDTRGARIGRNRTNEICVASDMRLAAESHAVIEFHRGAFYITDGGHSYSASVRIGIGHNGLHKKWYMDKEARFSAGNSIFLSKGVDGDGHLEVYAVEGPMKGDTLRINRKGATFGRSSDNTVCVPDRELSRKHSRIDYDEKSDRFTISDMGSTNGTYVQLVGPYGGRYKLNLNDHILVGRTGFSINRFDYGLSEEMGYRQSMEDACTIVQHLNIAPLCVPDLYPQSFFGVFDGHGGTDASHFLAQNLHVNVAHGILEESNNIFRILDEYAPTSIYDIPQALDAVDNIISNSLKASFLKTDDDFLSTSNNPQHGSTATTALILGKRLYCANVGDSRTMICRNFEPILLSQDHKPSREDESKRIRDAGGFVINGRVMGELAVSRAFGDVDFKKGIQSIIEQEGDGSSLPAPSGDGPNWDQPLLIAEPEIQKISIEDRDQFLLLACDGLFDVFTPEEVVTFVRTNMEKHGDSQRCCQQLTYDAIRKRNSRDNVSVILIILNKWY
jgi:serine/threonine protein phosphatase PrpC